MNKKKVKDENYLVINGWMINKLKLKSNELVLFALIYGFSQDEESWYTGGIQYLCEFLGVQSRQTIFNALKSLVEKGYIIKNEIVENNVKYVKYKANLEVVQNLDGGSTKNVLGVVQNLDVGGTKNVPNKEIYNNINNDINIYIDNCKEIIDYLNLKTGKKYRFDVYNTQELIKSKIKDGYIVNDFKIVIDKKYIDWKGTDFEKYLRPETLFGNKFESYLNQETKVKNKESSYDIEEYKNSIISKPLKYERKEK